MSSWVTIKNDLIAFAQSHLQLNAVGARGKLVADAWFAALAIEHACTWISTDSDFARFPDLDWRHPLKAA